MALTYDLTKIEDWKENYPTHTNADGTESMNGVTHMLIFCSMMTGIREITEKNAEEVFTRIRMSEVVHGGYLTVKDGGYRNFTLEDVTGHIGLQTNASDITKARFNTNINRQLREKIDREIKYTEKKLA